MLVEMLAAAWVGIANLKALESLTPLQSVEKQGDRRETL
jgi:hypothetical protein